MYLFTRGRQNGDFGDDLSRAPAAAVALGVPAVLRFRVEAFAWHWRRCRAALRPVPGGPTVRRSRVVPPGTPLPRPPVARRRIAGPEHASKNVRFRQEFHIHEFR